MFSNNVLAYRYPERLQHEGAPSLAAIGKTAASSEITYPESPDIETIKKLSESNHFRPNLSGGWVNNGEIIIGDVVDNENNERQLYYPSNGAGRRVVEKIEHWANKLAASGPKDLRAARDVWPPLAEQGFHYFEKPKTLAYYDRSHPDYQEDGRGTYEEGELMLYMAQATYRLCAASSEMSVFDQGTNYRQRMNGLVSSIAEIPIEKDEISKYEAISSFLRMLDDQNDELLNKLQPGFVHGDLRLDNVGIVFGEDGEGTFVLMNNEKASFPEIGESARPRLQDIADVYIQFVLDGKKEKARSIFLLQAGLMITRDERLPCYGKYSDFERELSLSIIERSLEGIARNDANKANYYDIAMESLLYLDRFDKNKEQRDLPEKIVDTSSLPPDFIAELERKFVSAAA